MQTPSDHSRQSARLWARWVLIAIYAPFGVLHLAASHGFLPIMPAWVPEPLAVIRFTGVCEIAGAAGLAIPRTRWLAGLMLGLYAVAVFPANVHHALSGVSVPPLPSSWWYHGPRLAFQPVFVWAALFAGGVIDWPYRRSTSVAHASRWMRLSMRNPRAT